MIEKQQIDGRTVYVAYLTSDMKPADKDSATMAKLVFEDGEGMIVSLGLKREGEQDSVSAARSDKLDQAIARMDRALRRI